ncbi:MAG: hypothetical protein FJ304_10640 [Planctomycetes bacterium]|nr:hypothetical protein [Planctomycetota bacterium]
MFATAAPSLDNTLPGATRRRVWASPDVRSHSVVVLTVERLHVAPLTGAPKPEIVAATVAAIAGCDDIDDLLGPFALSVDLASVRGVTLDLHTNSLIVEYAKGGTATAALTVVFATPETADACFTKLWRRLGDGYKLQPYRRDAWASARAPLTLLIGALLATMALALLLSVFEDMAAARAGAPDGAPASPLAPLARLLDWMDWRAVCALGGAAMAAAQVWLYRRLTRPPAALELYRT